MHIITRHFACAALTYLREVKTRFSGDKNVYDTFLEIMKEFKAQKCATDVDLEFCVSAQQMVDLGLRSQDRHHRGDCKSQVAVQGAQGAHSGLQYISSQGASCMGVVCMAAWHHMST